MSEVSYGLLKALGEKGLLSHEIVDAAMAGEHVSLPQARDLKETYLARFGDDIAASNNALWGMNIAEKSGQPYAHTGKVANNPTSFNPNFKITQPMQEIGHPGIMEPFYSKYIDPVPWSDSKFEITKNALNEAKQNNIPVKLNTSSDLIGRDDYLERIPKNSEINLYLPTKDEKLNRILFPGNPSRLRLEEAVQKLQDAGINVNAIEPTPDSIKEAISRKVKNENALKFGDDAETQAFINEKLNDPATFKFTPKLLSAAPLAANFKNPLDIIGQGAKAYEQAKQNIYRPIASQMDLTKDKSATEGMTNLMSGVLDPINAIPGAAGVGAAAVQGMGQAASDMNPQGYASGGVAGAPEFIPDSEFKPDSMPSASPKVQMPESSNQPAAFIPEDQFQSDSEKYGSLGQQSITALEGAARGATFGGSDVLENLFLHNKEEIKARKQENPLTSIGSSIAGGGALLGLTGGASGLLGLGEGTAATVLGGALEGGAFGAGSAISDAALGDPELNAQKVLAEVGIGAALGIGGSLAAKSLKSLVGKFGSAPGSVADSIDTAANDQNIVEKGKSAFANLINPETNLKPNAQKIVDIGQEYGLPVNEGMVSSDPWVQKAVDTLSRARPSFAGKRVEAALREGYEGATDVVNSVLPNRYITKNDFGEAIKDGITSQIESESQPFEDLYKDIKQDTEKIPLSEKSAKLISNNITEFIENPSIGKNSPAAKLGHDIADEIGDLKTVDDLRAYQSSLNQRISPTASPAEKRIIAIISDKLDNWERNTLKRYANNFISKIDITDPDSIAIWGDKVRRLSTLLDRIDSADQQYAPFRQKISGLASWLGKEKIQGAKHAIQFVSEHLEPEDLASKLSSKKYAGLYKFMDENFPQEAALMKEFQKSALKDTATKSGVFNPKAFFIEVDKLEPEIKEAIFSPDEIKKIDDMAEYLRSYPQDFNPSHTAHGNAFTQLFSLEGIKANLTDEAMLAYVKRMGALPEPTRPNPVEFGSEMAQKANKMSGAEIIKNKVDKKINDNIQDIIGSKK